MDKRDAAYTLYASGYLMGKISRMLGVSSATVGKWKKEDDWDKKMRMREELYQSNAQRVQKLISYQLRTLERLVQEWEALNESRLIDKGSIDALSKLYATIKQKDLLWSNYVQIMSEFTKYVNGQDSELAQKLTDIIDEFLNEKRIAL